MAYVTDAQGVQAPSAVRLYLGWAAAGATLVGAALLLNFFSYRFGVQVTLADTPAVELAAAMVMIGLAYLALAPLILATLRAGLGDHRRLTILIVIVGLGARLALFGSTPALESDWYRYLWDGAVTANGYNPYAVSPDDAQGEAYYYSLQPLAQSSGVVIEGINHSGLKTIYPPVAQAAFALAYVLQPWSLDAWRAVCLIAELASLVLLLALLRLTGQPAIWVALYWWNPLVVKELINSAHMEAIVTPFVLGALWLALRGRPVSAMTSLAFAVGAKLWPVLLAPLLLRSLAGAPRRMVVAGCVFALTCATWAVPPLLGGIDETSGLVAYAQHWRNNSAHFAALMTALRSVLDGFAVPAETTAFLVRLSLAGAAGLMALAVARRDVSDADDLMARACFVAAALFLLMPSQFPWYAVWMLPFLIFRPWLGLLAVTGLVPVYYASFHFQARESYDVYRDGIVWLIWAPVWTLLAAEGWRVLSGRGGFLFAGRTRRHA